MPPVSAFVVVAAGAVLGAWLRWYLVGAYNGVLRHLPLGTLIANIGGGLAVGFAVAWLAASPQIHPNVRLFVITGFLGALTTFSSFSAESLELLESQSGEELRRQRRVRFRTIGQIPATR